MNEQDKKLVGKYFPKYFEYNQNQTVIMVKLDETVDICRKSEQMEKDIKKHCKECFRKQKQFDFGNSGCTSDWCEFHKYGFWKE